MKHKLLYTIVFAAVLGSCSLDRYPLNGPSTGTFPSTAEETRAGVLGAYKAISNMPTWQYEPFARWIDHLTDIGAVRRGLQQWDLFKTSVQTSQSSAVGQLYTQIYKAAGRIHLVLDNLDNILESGAVSEQEYLQYKAELLLIRAYVYDLACQFYGGIPFIDHSLGLHDYQYARTPREEVTERLMNDISDELIDALPLQWPYAEWGTCRIGRVAAYTLKARIALNWGMYEEAARCSKIALELGDGVYELTPLDTKYYATAADGEPDPTPLFGFAGESSSKEIMWAAQYNILAASNVHYGIYTFSPRILNGSAGAGPTQSFMDSFQCLDGKSIAESPMYDWKNPWRNRDPRLDLYTVRPDSRIMGIQCTYDCTVTTVHDYVTNTDITNADVTGNKHEYGINGVTGGGGYMWRKFSDIKYRLPQESGGYGGITGASFEDELNCPLMRFAELLLIDAEANIEWEGGDLTRARGEINRVRARAGMPAVETADRDELRTALRYERKIELCAEGFRWFDLRRWHTADCARLGSSDILEKALSGDQYAPAFSETSAPMTISNAKPVIDESWIVTYDTSDTWDGAPVNCRTHITLVWQDRDKLWPIPYDEWTTNPLIGQENQNPGY